MRTVSRVAMALGVGLSLDGSPAAALPDADGVLILGIQREGKPDPEVREVVRTRLLQMAVAPAIHGPRLGNTDLACTAADCLERLAATYRARWVVGGQIIGSDNNYVINLWLFDRDTQGLRQGKADCNDCELDALRDRVAYTAGDLFSPEKPAPPTPPPRPQQVPTPTPVEPPKLPLCPVGYYSFARGLAVGGTAALLAGGLLTGVVLTGLNNKDYVQGQSTYQLGAHMGLAYGFSALPAAGLAASLLVNRPPHRGMSQCRERPATRWTFKRGIALGSTGALALGSLVTSLALAGVSNSVRYSTDTPYSLGGPAVLFGVGSAAAAVVGVAFFFWL